MTDKIEWWKGLGDELQGDIEITLDFYKKYEDRIILMPASHKKEYHNAFPGGYVEHVNRVVARIKYGR